jgi:hypothetical protein
VGGEWDTFLNTPVFKKLWMQVFRDGQFKSYAWTAKVDPDAVFLPPRLRDLLSAPPLGPATPTSPIGDLGVGPQGAFINSCAAKGTLHGAIEVLSRKALEVYGGGHSSCTEAPQEDVFMRMCLLTLGVAQATKTELLADTGGGCGSDDAACTSKHVAFHPFKELAAYQHCLGSAEGTAWP